MEKQKRRLSNFIESYCKYAEHHEAPDKFNRWCALSVIAGVLERKVWLHMGRTTYPNVLVVLTAYPGVGKSTCIDKAAHLIERVRDEHNKRLNILSGPQTQAGLIAGMAVQNKFIYGDQEIKYTAGYYHASEGSDSGFTNYAGEWTATVTQLYDCAASYRKTLKLEKIDWPNPCFNLLAGATFNFLSKVVNQDTAFGGLASRLTFPLIKVHEKKHVDLDPDQPEKVEKLDKELEDDLLHDLIQIHEMVGRFRMTREAVAILNAWSRKNTEEYNATNSERLKSITVRKGLLLKKLMMICSAAESSDLMIKEHHVKEAIDLTEDVTKDLTHIISSAMIGDKTTQEATTQFIIQQLALAGEAGLTTDEMWSKFLQFGGDISKYDLTTKAMVTAKQISLNDRRFKLLVDPNFNI